MPKQKTIRQAVTLQGKGLHTGLDIEITFKPAPANHGYKICRVDIEGKPTIDALAENVQGTERGTVLSQNGVQVSTVEHALAALYANDIDNCLMEVNAPEFPILDGSAKIYFDAIKEAGIETLFAPRNYFYIKKKMEIKDENGVVRFFLMPDNDFSVLLHTDYSSPVLPPQEVSIQGLESFEREVAPCRTFVFVREIEPLLGKNLIKGGSLENAVVIYDKELDEEKVASLCQLARIPLIERTRLGILNDKPLLFENEPARHKLLDVIGDLALVGRFIKGHIVGNKPGHKINNIVARALRKEAKFSPVQPPNYNFNDEPALNINQIKEMLPHRYPLLFVDKVLSYDDISITAIKNVTINEALFNGHFPCEPVLPGVLLVEAMAQVGGILVATMVDEPQSYSTYLMKINNVKFRRKVVPGDTLVFIISIMDKIRRGIISFQGNVFVGDTKVCEAEFVAMIIKNEK